MISTSLVTLRPMFRGLKNQTAESLGNSRSATGRLRSNRVSWTFEPLHSRLLAGAMKEDDDSEHIMKTQHSAEIFAMEEGSSTEGSLTEGFSTEGDHLERDIVVRKTVEISVSTASLGQQWMDSTADEYCARGVAVQRQESDGI